MKDLASRYITIRRGNAEDIEQIFQVTIDSIVTLCAKDYSKEQLQSLLEDKTKRFREGIKLGDTIFVAETNSKIIGYSSLLSRTIGAMFVSPKFTRQGVGKRLLEAIETEAIARKRKDLTAIASLTGVPFYQACGYRILGNYSLSLDLHAANKIYIPCMRMKKSLLANNMPQQEVIWDVWMGMGKMAKWLFEGGVSK